jgi:cobalt-zinc-cadmium efflux system protein
MSRSGDVPVVSAAQASHRRTLLQVLLLNLGLTAILIIGGLIAESTALIANALDNGSDALVYAISYFAVVRSMRWKAMAATLSGILLIILSLGVVAEVIRRFASGAEPLGAAMIGIAVLAAAINAWCLKLLAGIRGEGVNLRAAWTFSVNDFLSNFGILVAGALVWGLGRTWPDLVVGLIVAVVAGYGGVEILRDAARSHRRGEELN